MTHPCLFPCVSLTDLSICLSLSSASNIVLTSAKAVLVDFGLSVQMSEDSQVYHPKDLRGTEVRRQLRHAHTHTHTHTDTHSHTCTHTHRKKNRTSFNQKTHTHTNTHTHPPHPHTHTTTSL